MSGPPVNFWNESARPDHRVMDGLRVHLALEAQAPQQPLCFERVVADGVPGVERRQELMDRSHAATPIALVIADVKIAPVRVRSKSRTRSSPARTEMGAQRFLGQDARHRVRDRGGLLVGEAQAAVAEGLGHGGRREGHDGQLVMHRFEQRHAEPLVIRQAHEHVRSAVVRGEHRVRDGAGHSHAVAEAERGDRGAQCALVAK